MPPATHFWKWGVLMTLRYTKERGLLKDTPQPHTHPSNPRLGGSGHSYLGVQGNKMT